MWVQQAITTQKTNIFPDNWWLEDEVLFRNGRFSKDMLIFAGFFPCKLPFEPILSISNSPIHLMFVTFVSSKKHHRMVFHCHILHHYYTPQTEHGSWKNHPIEKENHEIQTSISGFHVNFPGCSSWSKTKRTGEMSIHEQYCPDGRLLFAQLFSENKGASTMSVVQ